MGSHSLLQGNFLTQGLSPGLLDYRRIPYHLSHQRSPCLASLSLNWKASQVTLRGGSVFSSFCYPGLPDLLRAVETQAYGKKLLRVHETRLQPAEFVGGTQADKVAGSAGQRCGLDCGMAGVPSLLGEAHWLNPPPQPGTIVTICMSSLMTGGLGKEHGTNKPPPIGRVQERSKWDTTCPTISQNPSLWHSSWLNKACTTRKDSWVRMIS